MKISDIQHGKSTVVEVVPVSYGDFGTLQALDEAELYSSGLESEALLRIGQVSWTIEGIDAHHDELLRRILLRGLPKVAWVAALRPKDAALATASLVLEVREFPSENAWPEPVELGVDEKVVEFARKKRRRLSALDDVIKWLEDHILVTDTNDSVARTAVG